ncbi:MAG: mannose-1-phosphate guanylyltransferase/mannose-6-phosphate isomerase [Thermodesulfobacteriota bacterium]
MFDNEIEVYTILLAGGVGTRLWPLSRELLPKQFISLYGSDSLIQSTIKRLLPIIDVEKLRIVCGESHYHEIKRHMETMSISPTDKIITEPCGRNTAPAILLATLNILKSDRDAVVLVFPADHMISNIVQFHKKIIAAINLAKIEFIVTLGVKPTYPETGYGYIEGGEAINEGALSIKRFVEKPDEKTAEDYIKRGNFFWNSGTFAFKASVIMREFEAYEPALLKSMWHMVSIGTTLTTEEYSKLPTISFDYAIMEKTKRGVVIPSDFGWSDIGSWKSLYAFLPKDKDNNVIEGDVISSDTRGCLIKGEGRLIVTSGLRNIAVVETADAVLVSDLDKSKDIKSIVNDLAVKGRSEYQTHTKVYRPWGYYLVLEEKDNTKVKRIVVNPGARLSLQKHHHRSEHWVIVQGIAKVINGDLTLILEEKQSTFIPQNNLHRIENIGKIPLEIVEVEIGDYLEEDDIVRYEDDFGRADSNALKKN